MAARQPGADGRADVAAVHEVPLVAETFHQRRERVGHRRRREIRGGRRVSESGDGGDDDGEIVREELEHRQELHERSRPAMEQQDRRPVRARRMDEVHAQSLHLRAEVAVPVPLCAAGGEVEAIAPPVGQGAHPLEPDAPSDPERRRPPRRAQARAQVFNVLFRKCRRERFELHGRRTIARAGVGRETYSSGASVTNRSLIVTRAAVRRVGHEALVRRSPARRVRDGQRQTDLTGRVGLNRSRIVARLAGRRREPQRPGVVSHRDHGAGHRSAREGVAPPGRALEPVPARWASSSTRAVCSRSS